MLEFTLRQYTCTEQTVLLKELRVTQDHDEHVYKIITKYSYLIFQYLFLPCPMTFLKVSCPEPDTLLAWID